MTEVTPVNATPDQLRDLQHLLDDSTDAHAWFDKMADKAEPGFRFVALKFRGLHNEQKDRIAAIITAMGGDADESGSVMSAVRRTSVSLRAMVDEIDDDLDPDIARVETHLVEQFESLLSKLGPSRYRDELAQMKGEVTRLLGELDAPAG